MGRLNHINVNFSLSFSRSSPEASERRPLPGRGHGGLARVHDFARELQLMRQLDGRPLLISDRNSKHCIAFPFGRVGSVSHPFYQNNINASLSTKFRLSGLLKTFENM